MKKIAKFDHDYSESSNPYGENDWYNPKTFSIGIFQWEAKVSGKGLKKRSIIYRVKGMYSDKEKIITRANEICNRMDSGTWIFDDKQSETVKS